MGFKIGDIDVSKIYLGDTEVTKAYLEGVEIILGESSPTNYIANGTFDNDDNLELDASYAVTGGVVAYTHSGAASCYFDLTETIEGGVNCTFTITFLNGIGDNRFRIYASHGGSNTEVKQNTTYANGTHDVSITTPVGEITDRIRILTSPAANDFEFDNVSLTKD